MQLEACLMVCNNQEECEEAEAVDDVQAQNQLSERTHALSYSKRVGAVRWVSFYMRHTEPHWRPVGSVTCRLCAGEMH